MKSKVLWLFLLGLLLASCCSTQEAEPVLRAPKVGALAPDFTISTLEGQTVSLSDFRGRPVLLNFWATWCPPCRAEMPHLQAVFEAAASIGLVVLAVDLREDQTTVGRFIQKQGYTFSVGLDTNGKVAEDYRVEGIPTSFFIDGSGIIRSIKVGAFASETEIWEMLEGILPAGG